MNDPVQILIDDHVNLSIVHHHFRNQLDRFQRQITSENLNLLSDIVDYLKNYPECCHHAIEDKIYHLIRSRISDQRLADFISKIEKQHNQMRVLANHIQESLGSIANDIVVNKDIVVTHCRQYVVLYEEHIHNENLYLLPNIEFYLSEQELTSIYSELEAQQDPLFGPMRQEAYKTLFHHITSTLIDG